MKVNTLVALVSLILIVTACKGTQRATPEKLAPEEEIVQHPLSKNEAYTRAYRWAAENYASANEVVQMEDKESGTLVMKGAYERSVANVPGKSGIFLYTLTLDIRDEKMRLTFDPQGWADYRTSNNDVDNAVEHFRMNIKPSLVSALEEVDDF